MVWVAFDDSNAPDNNHMCNIIRACRRRCAINILTASSQSSCKMALCSTPISAAVRSPSMFYWTFGARDAKVAHYMKSLSPHCMETRLNRTALQLTASTFTVEWVAFDDSKAPNSHNMWNIFAE
jgi:hypothetical protein